MRLIVGRIDALKSSIDPGSYLVEQLCVTKILSKCITDRAPAARSDHTITADQGDRRGRSEIDVVVEFGQMVRIERGDDNAAERLVNVQEAPCELHGPFAAGATNNRLADEKLICVVV